MRERQSARAILLDEAGRVLLIECEDPVALDPRRPDIRRYWVTPGGGVEPGETAQSALRRELREELGLSSVRIERLAATREIVLHFPDGPLVSRESYFLCHVTGATALNHDGMSEGESSVFRGARWWPPGEIEASAEMILPTRLLEFIEANQVEGAVPHLID
jgi:8-oxo-dGTP pyrophosphatase MutT (NUDIX family)